MKSLWSISFLALVISGCISIKPLNVTPDQSTVTPYISKGESLTFPDSSYLFKATLDIRNHHLTGLLLIKQMVAPSPTSLQQNRKDSTGIYRIVFVNEVGMTYFDLEMRTDSFKVISCFTSLNKKSLLRIFETDFRILTWRGTLYREKCYRQAATDARVISGKVRKYVVWQTFSPAGDTLFKTSAKSTIADPVFITYDKYSHGFPLKITLENPFIGMKLTLRKLDHA
jgi:hypothetical protein